MSVKKVFEYMLTGLVIYFCATLLFGVSRDILWAFNLLAFLGAMIVLAIPASLFVQFLRWLLKPEADPAERHEYCGDDIELMKFIHEQKETAESAEEIDPKDFSKILESAHSILSNMGVPLVKSGEICDDPKCDSYLTHRLHFVEQRMIALEAENKRLIK